MFGQFWTTFPSLPKRQWDTLCCHLERAAVSRLLAKVRTLKFIRRLKISSSVEMHRPTNLLKLHLTFLSNFWILDQLLWVINGRLDLTRGWTRVFHRLILYVAETFERRRASLWLIKWNFELGIDNCLSPVNLSSNLIPKYLYEVTTGISWKRQPAFKECFILRGIIFKMPAFWGLRDILAEEHQEFMIEIAFRTFSRETQIMRWSSAYAKMSSKRNLGQWVCWLILQSKYQTRLVISCYPGLLQCYT